MPCNPFPKGPALETAFLSRLASRGFPKAGQRLASGDDLSAQ